MADTIAHLTKAELQALIEAAVEEKLLQLLGDPDAGLALKKAVRERLAHQRQAVAAGERGRSLSDMVHELGLE